MKPTSLLLLFFLFRLAVYGSDDSITILFDSDSASIKASEIPKLNAALEKQISSIKGFTDADGSDDYNIDLSLRRVNAVRSYLLDNGYKTLPQISYYGENQPISDNMTANGKANNRRVEIFFEPQDYLSSYNLASLTSKDIDVAQLRRIIGMNYDSTSNKQLKKLSDATNGLIYFSKSPKHLGATISRLISMEVVNKTDIVFLIDKTASMIDDINNVKLGLEYVIRSLKNKADCRTAIVTYGDRIFDGPEWFTFQALTEDLTSIQKQINDITPVNGGNAPESVYDAIVETVEQQNWTADYKKMIVVIGDAPPLESKKFTQYGREEVIAVCSKNGIDVNIYPILIPVGLE